MTRASRKPVDLAEYRRKRNFALTSEPSESSEPDGRVETRDAAQLRFVVQKHQARRLHYDFRLELDGTLKSWAVPKGPSLNPEDKRLALQVEDHPIAYRSFEGIIPKGNYGAGTVMVWDAGTYHAAGTTDRKESEAILRKGLSQGQLHFILNGRKLCGEFALVKIRGREPNAWLLVKAKDEFARSSGPADDDRSAKSSRTMAEIAASAEGRGEVWSSSDLPAVDIPDAPPGSPSGPITPMKATLVTEAFDREGWIFEMKWDGYRAIAEVRAGEILLYSRRAQTFQDKYPSIVTALRAIRHEAVLDGEIVVLDSSGKPSFQMLQLYQKSGEGELVYYVFDLLYLDGHDLRSLPLLRRKHLLREILPDLPDVRYSDHFETDGRRFFEAARAMGIEGIIAKDGASLYQEATRSASWLKMKTHEREEVVIGGYTEPRGSRKKLGSLVIGTYEGGVLKYAGSVGTGFNQQSLADIHEQLKPLVTEECPFEPCPKLIRKARWVRPRLVCEVSFQERTKGGRLRQPVFEGLRPDKAPRSVHPELPRPTETVLSGARKAAPVLTVVKQDAPDNQIIVAGNHRVELSHMNKVYWPEEKITKRELIDYYHQMAKVILPYLLYRPQVLYRKPEGIASEGFFQKNIDHAVPPYLKLTEIYSASDKRMLRYAVVENEASLLYLVNLGCIELHPWSSRLPHLDRPDYLILDLDPEDIAFTKVVETAVEIRRLLEELEIPGYCKTSGKTGLHIYIPLHAKFDFNLSRRFAELLVHVVHASLPAFTSLERNPSVRQGKVYLDFLQNRRAQTVASAYSVRASPGATVSTPLRWEELTKKLDPADFTMKSVFGRLDRYGDLFTPVLGEGIDLEKSLDKLARALERAG
jgi:bifunctional non-homologous end joining protein LigD